MSDIRTGYHYTSLDCWKKIQKEGLRPYSIKKPQLYEHFGTDTVQGVWLWLQRPTGLSHVGCLIFQMGTKGVIEAVLLHVQYDWEKILRKPGDRYCYVQLPHQGTIENLEYHDGRDIGVIVTKRIPPKNIDLIRAYNLLDAWGRL